MDYEKNTLLSLIGFVCNYPLYLIIDGKISEHFPPDNVLMTQFPNPFSDDPAMLSALSQCASSDISIVQENDCIHYGILKLNSTCTCLLGPIASPHIQETDIREYYYAHHIHNTDARLPKAFFQKTASVLNLISYCITGKICVTEPVFISFHPSGSDVSETSDISQSRLLNYQLQNSEQAIRHLPYTIEKQLTQAIHHGNVEELQDIFRTPIQDGYSFGTMATTARKQSEYQAVITISLAARTAIDSGVDPYTAYDLCDLYLQKLSTAFTQADYTKIMVKSLLKFCNIVHNTREQEIYSAHISKCKHFIATHLNKPFDMQDLGDYVGLSAKYIGTLFRQEEGQTLKSYILQCRIEAARNMLKYSDYTVSEISSYLCFSSQSHFGTVFQKFEGLSPNEFRKKNKPMNF